jgi:hypothetical protein
VPHLVGVLRQRDALELALAAGVEQAELDALGVLREEREVDAAAVQVAPRGWGSPGQTRSAPRLMRA